jgi:L-fuculose-phosphate aldolase
MTGKQLAGRRKRTSEVLLHLEIYRQNPQIKSVVHCHPPHATAFSVAGEEIPTCILPEVEVFLGVLPTAAYETPGAQGFADTIRPFVEKAKVVVLKNHGTVSWGDSLEQAFWYTEILDAYCRILMLAKQVGRVERISEPKVNELLDLKERFGLGVDPRRLENADLCANIDWGRGFKDSSVAAGAAMASAGGNGTGVDDQEVERLVQEITDRIMAAM